MPVSLVASISITQGHGNYKTGMWITGSIVNIINVYLQNPKYVSSYKHYIIGVKQLWLG